MPSRINRSYMGIIYTSAFILTTVCFFFLAASFLISNQILNRGLLFMDNTRAAKFEVIRSRLILKDIITNNRQKEIKRAKRYFDAANRNIHALISSGNAISKWLNPLNGRKFQKKLSRISSDLKQVLKTSTSRLTPLTITGQKPGEDKDDGIFCIALIDQLSSIEMRFQSILTSRFSRIKQMQYVLIAVLFFTFLSTALYTRANLKFRRKVEKKLTKKSEIFFSDMKEKEAKLKSLLKLAPIGILKTSEEKFRLLAENTVDCIWLMDLNLTFRYINPSVFHMLGYTAEQWIGSRLDDHFPPQEIELMGAVIEEELMKGANSKGVVFETNIYNKQGQLIPVEISGKILFDSAEQPVGLQGTTRDISRRKQAEDEVKRLNRDLERRVATRTAQLNAVNKELESFAYSVSHDLRAPLRSIGGFSKILLEDYYDVLDDAGRDYLLRVQRNTDRMEDLIENMLKFSRTMSCDMKKEPVDLSALARVIIEELRTQDNHRKVKAVIAPNLIIEGDSHLIRAVLDNLIGNAWKFTSRNKDTARIEFGMRNENGNAVYFIKDNGAGFDMAHSAKLFSVFQRLHTTSEFPGSGVGLATVARIIQRHGGRIWAEGEPERGAAFYFTL